MTKEETQKLERQISLKIKNISQFIKKSSNIEFIDTHSFFLRIPQGKIQK